MHKCMAAITQNPDVVTLIGASILELDDMVSNQYISPCEFILTSKTEFASPFRKLLCQVSMGFRPSIL